MQGQVKEASHYYPHGLPMGDSEASAHGFVQNRHKHQGNEYIQEVGLDWMDFHARQYDPQIGRFLGVDPLADVSVQDRFSPYAAMGNNPVRYSDPGGLLFGDGEDNNKNIRIPDMIFLKTRKVKILFLLQVFFLRVISM